MLKQFSILKRFKSNNINRVNFSSSKNYYVLPPLVSPKLAYDSFNEQSSNVVFIDASWHLNKERNANRINEYYSKHLPGAIFFDIDNICDRETLLPHMLPSQELFAEKMGEFGITNTTQVIVYNTSDSFSAPRVWWTFKVFNHQRVSVLDGGLESWIKEGYPIESGTPVLKQKSEYSVKGINKQLLVGLDDVLGVVKTGYAQICDVRPQGRFLAQEPEPRPGLEGGHIPGSLNIPARVFLDDKDCTKFKSSEEIEKIFQSNGVVRNARVIFSCGSGVTASLAAFARHLTGISEVKSPVYDGSWAEWGSLPNTPKLK